MINTERSTSIERIIHISVLFNWLQCNDSISMKLWQNRASLDFDALHCS